MYAVVETGGKQYRVELGTELEVELLDVEPGQSVTFDRVLLIADGDDTAVGRPLVADAAVHAEVVRQDRGEKLIVYKYRPKARRRVKKGHRQALTVLRVTDLRVAGRSAADDARKAERDAKSERQRLEEAAARQAAEDAALAAKLAERTQAEPETKPKAKTTRPKAGTRAKNAAGEPASAAAVKDQADAAPKRTRSRSTTKADEPASTTAPSDGKSTTRRSRTKKDE